MSQAPAFNVIAQGGPVYIREAEYCCDDRFMTVSACDSRHMADTGQWSTHDDCTGRVLGAVSLRLRDLAESACLVQMELGLLESRCQEGGASHG